MITKEFLLIRVSPDGHPRVRRLGILEGCAALRNDAKSKLLHLLIKMDNGAPATLSTSSFLQLPAELRDSIYALVLTPPHIPHLRRLATRGLCSDYILPSLNLSPALLRTCRQVHDEATSILYGANQFASHPSLLTAMPYLISPRRPITDGSGRWRIKKWYIHLRLDVDPRFT